VSETPEPLPVEEFILALRAHAASIDGAELSPDAVAPSVERLQAAALAYDEAVFTRSGLGAVFDELSDLDDADWDDEGLDLDVEPGDDDLDGSDQDDEFEAGFAGEPGVARISVLGQWDFLVRDPAALRQLAEDRLRADIPDLDDETLQEHTVNSGAALDTLIGHDDLLSYPGLEAARAQWTVRLLEPTAPGADSAGADSAGAGSAETE
jgi:hypothetical protein